MANTNINRRVIDSLFSHNIISNEAKDFALTLLYPKHNWGLWVSRMLLWIGISLILSGIIYFCAFNWAIITPLMKFTSIQLAIFTLIGLSYFYGLEKVIGKVFLLTASVLVGVFIAVFGQVYQSGADAYTLFLTWALLILPWVVISEFAASWIVWMVIANLAIILYSVQVGSYIVRDMMYSNLIIFNSLFLVIKEYAVLHGASWLSSRGIRKALVIAIIIFAFITAINFIFGGFYLADFVGAGLSLLVHVMFYFVYRYKLRDIFVVSITTISALIILEAFIIKVMDEFINYKSWTYTFSIGFMTLGLTIFATAKLRMLAKKMENKND